MHRILPSVTTHGKGDCTWRRKLREIPELGLQTVAVFLTGLRASERSEFYRELEQAAAEVGLRVPFVHAVSTMGDEEFRYLRDRFGTERFNLHPVKEFPLQHELSREVRSWIYIENSSIEAPLAREDLDGFAGLCIDLSHLEDMRRSNPAAYRQTIDLLSGTPIGANHISAVSDIPANMIGEVPVYSKHLLEDLSEVSYLRRAPRAALSDLCAIELENSLAEQLLIREEIFRGLEAGTESEIAVPLHAV